MHDSRQTRKAEKRKRSLSSPFPRTIKPIKCAPHKKCAPRDLNPKRRNRKRGFRPRGNFGKRPVQLSLCVTADDRQIPPFSVHSRTDRARRLRVLNYGAFIRRRAGLRRPRETTCECRSHNSRTKVGRRPERLMPDTSHEPAFRRPAPSLGPIRMGRLLGRHTDVQVLLLAASLGAGMAN